MAVLYMLVALMIACVGALPVYAGDVKPKPSAATTAVPKQPATAKDKAQPASYTSFVGKTQNDVFKHFTQADPNWDFQFWKNFAEGEQIFSDGSARVQFAFDKDKVTMVRGCAIHGQPSENTPAPYGPWMDAKAVIKPQPKVFEPKDKPERVTKNGVDLDAYMAEVISRIKKNWHPAKPGTGPVVSIVLDADGKVQPNSSGIFKRSGDPLLDKQAIAALKATSYPPLGAGWRLQHFGCQLNMADWSWPR